MYRTKAIYQLSDFKKQSSWKILRLFEIYRQSESQAPVYIYYILGDEDLHYSDTNETAHLIQSPIHPNLFRVTH